MIMNFLIQLYIPFPHSIIHSILSFIHIHNSTFTTLKLKYSQILLYLFERPSLGFRHYAPDKYQRQDHHAAEKDKCVVASIGNIIHENGKGPGDNCGHDPMSEAAEGAALRTNGIGEYLRDEYPDHRSLRHCEECDKTHQVKNNILVS